MGVLLGVPTSRIPGFVVSSGNANISGTMLDLKGFAAVPLAHDPYHHMVMQDFVRPEWQKAIAKDFPQIDKGPEFRRSWPGWFGPAVRSCVYTVCGIVTAGELWDLNSHLVVTDLPRDSHPR